MVRALMRSNFLITSESKTIILKITPSELKRVDSCSNYSSINFMVKEHEWHGLGKTDVKGCKSNIFPGFVSRNSINATSWFDYDYDYGL